MIGMDDYSQIAHVIFGNEVKKRRERYYSLQKQLRQGHMATSYEVYVSVAYLTSIIIGIIGALVGIVLGFLLRNVILSNTNFANIRLPFSTAALLPYAGIIVLFVSMIVMSVIGAAVTYGIFMLIPSFNASERKSKINKGLPSAVTFMYALSKGGTDIIAIMRSLYDAETTYGEVSREIGFIIRDMDYFGNDLRVAIINCISQTPSDMLQDLLSNMLSVIDSGGDITAYFSGRVDTYRMRIMQDQKSFLDILGLIAESYVTMFVAGPLFIIIMVSVMAIMGSGSPTMLYVIIYAALPLGSVIFVLMISMLTPQDEDRPKPFDVNIISQYDMEIKATEDAKAENSKMGQIKKSRENVKTKAFMANPLAGIQKDPIKVLYICVPIAIILISVLVVLTYGDLALALKQVTRNQIMLKTTDPFSIYGPVIGYFDDLMVFFILIVLVPLTYFYEVKNMRERKIASEMPDFLKKLASTNETGMTLTQSINLISNSNFGTMSSEVRKVHQDLEWGTDVNTALKRMANALHTPTSTRMIMLITKASETSGDIKDVLNIAANDARLTEQMRRDRSDSMLIYVVIIFISFCVFLYCVYTLTSSFIPVMASAGASSASSSGTASKFGASAFITSFNPEDYYRLFFHAGVIQGLFSGLLAGQMGEGNWMSGLKYSLVMMVIAYVIFTVFI